MNDLPYIIGIAGNSGAGKTCFLNGFKDHFKPNEITLISQDNYYRPVPRMSEAENRLYNFDQPEAIDHAALFNDISTLIAGGSVHRTEYTFNNPGRKANRLILEPAPILLVEGLLIFHFSNINQLFHHRIFIDVDAKTALQRRMKRDLEERGYPREHVEYKWVHHVMPAYRQYLLPYRERCDQIITNNDSDPTPISETIRDIARYLRGYFF